MKQLILLLGPVVVSTCFLIGCPSHAETPNAVQHDAEAIANKVGEKVEKVGEKTQEAADKAQDKVQDKAEEVKAEEKKKDP